MFIDPSRVHLLLILAVRFSQRCAYLGSKSIIAHLVAVCVPLLAQSA